MQVATGIQDDTGLEVITCSEDPEFASRRIHHRDIATQMEAMRDLGSAFIERPDEILQELVNTAVKLCEADSAGISIERQNGTDENFYHWVATAGNYSAFNNAMLPRYPSACGLCLERGLPQHFRVRQRFFDLMGIEAPLVTDGILLPWRIDETRGTIFIMAHERSEAFDAEDLRMMLVLANFAALGVRQQRLQKELLDQARSNAAVSMANSLAHQINNPLQSVTNVIYLAENGSSGPADAASLALELREPVQRLSTLVRELLAVPLSALRPPVEI